MSKEFVPDGYMSEMFYSDEEPELKEKVRNLRKLERGVPQCSRKLATA